MSPWVKAALVAGVVAILTWGIFALLGALVRDIDGLERLSAWVLLIPVALVVVLLGSLLGGFAGGWTSRRIDAAIASVAGYLAVSVGALMLRAGPSEAPSDAWSSVVVLSVLVVAGHLTGVAVRPRLRPA